jgi:hypothetical protein
LLYFALGDVGIYIKPGEKEQVSMVVMSINSLKELTNPEYWNKKYADNAQSEEPVHEWVKSFKELQPLFEKWLPNPSLAPRILHLGCGDSVRALWTDLTITSKVKYIASTAKLPFLLRTYLLSCITLGTKTRYASTFQK